MRHVFWLAACVLVVGCEGSIDDPGTLPPPMRPPGTELPEPLPSGEQLAPRGLTRLSALEYDRSLIVLLEDDTQPARLLLPEDPRTPFDNDYSEQEASAALIDGEKLLAEDAADRLLEDVARRDRIVGCMPSAADDETCFRTFVSDFLRRAFRRDVEEADLSFFVNGDTDIGWPGALEVARTFDDFYEGVRSIVQIVLQDPEFLYRVEIGTPHETIENVFRLSDYEIATRLSFFLWGSIPDDVLLDRAAAGELQDSSVRLAEAQRLLGDERARARFALFHSMWLGYEKLVPASSPLGVAMRAETRSLTDRVLFEDAGPWQDIFRFEQTYVDAELAENYGLPAPAEGESGWVDYEMAERRGIFAHGSFLAIGLKAGDTSPVMRGIAIQESVFCTPIPPPPTGVNVDEGPVSDALCKPERFAAHRSGGCASCHANIDPVGFGMENFDGHGQFREYETDNPATEGDESTCRIEGQGELPGAGTFRGPAELATRGLESGLIRACFVTQLHRLLTGRGRDDTREVDRAVMTSLDSALPAGDFTLAEVVEAVVGSETFVLRREDG